MAKTASLRNPFFLGALLGVVGGMVLGTVATVGAGDHVAELSRRATRKLFGADDSIRWELLGQ